MCGIVGYTGNKSAIDILLYGMKTLEYRGYDSAGISVTDDKGDFHTVKTTNRVEALRKKSKKLPISCTGIGHTRWATHGEPSKINAHPQLTHNFAVVHNGIIENYSRLKEELIKSGENFESDTDTEVIPHLLEKSKEKSFLKLVIKTVALLEGSFALAILSKKEEGTIIAARRFSPLIIGLSGDGNFVASDITAVLPYTKKVIYLEDGETAEVKKDSVTVYDSRGLKIQKKIIEIKNSVKTVDKGSFAHYMLKEIYEQPKAIREIINRHIKDNTVIFKGLYFDNKKIKAFDKIRIVACGSAYHAGVAAKYVFESLIKTEVITEIASEYRYKENFDNEKTFFIAISQSGETADTIAAANFAKQRGAYVLSVVNVEESSLSKLSDDVIYTKAGTEIAVATTKGYTTQLLILYLLALYLADIKGTLQNGESFINELKSLPQKTEEILKNADYIKKLAKQAGKIKSVFFIGRNTDYATCLEGSLKLKEISYINSEAYAAGELKHGTISLIEDGTPVMAVITNKKLLKKTESNIKEVKSRGAQVLAVLRESDKKIYTLFDKVIFIPDTNDLFMPLLSVVPLQMYAYFIALNRGCDIDKPKNLAKSVTVE